MEVQIKQFEEYFEIYVNGAKFWEGQVLTPKVLSALLMTTGTKTTIENVRGIDDGQELPKRFRRICAE